MGWTKNENVIWEEIDDGALLIDSKSGSRWTLSATAAAAWKHCDGKRTLDEMADVLRQERKQLLTFCRQFETLGLLKGKTALGSSLAFETDVASPFSFQLRGVGNGPRRRPSPRGNSGPG